MKGPYTEKRNVGSRDSASRARRRLQGTAHHEAGHAVAQSVLTHVAKLRRVTIVPDARNLGIAQSHLRPSFRPGVEADLREIVDEIVVLLSGAAAERRFAGRANHVGAQSDYHKAVALACCVAGGEEEAQAIIRWLLARAARFVEHRWSAIEAVAQALLERKVLSGAEVRAVIAGDQQRRHGRRRMRGTARTRGE